MAEQEFRNQATPMDATSDERIDQVIGNLLRFGVLVSALVVLAGGILYLDREGAKPATEQPAFHETSAHRRPPLAIIRDAWHLRSGGIIELGLLLLILTPIARVVFSVVAFALQRDWAYVAFTLLVLAILLYSLFSGHIH
jgi:uncharacterized membrane protein